jgi:Fe2+ transport system protein FeoA
VARTCALPCEECELLAAMGLCDRCPIRVCRRGRAWIVHARSTRLALSNQLAERITVEEPPAIAC